MGELSKIIAGLDGLTPDETAELSRPLARRGYAPERAEREIVSLEDAEAWRAAEPIALQRDAVRLAESLERSEARIAAQCAALMSASR